MKPLYLSDNELRAILNICSATLTQYETSDGELDYAGLGDKSVNTLTGISNKINRIYEMFDNGLTLTHPKHACNLSDEELRMWYQINTVKALLSYCDLVHGATIRISVSHDGGDQAAANLCDHAALNSALVDALEYFQSEL